MKEMRRNPALAYTGVTGLMVAYEGQGALGAHCPPQYYPHPAPPRHLMLGVLVSSKTLAGQTNKWPNRFPKIKAIASIFGSHPSLYNTLHYSTDDGGSLSDQLAKLVEIGGPNLHGIQINHAWPEPGEIERFRQCFPDLSLILQIGRGAFEVIGGSAQTLVRTLAEHYEGRVHHILLDPSGGHGKPPDEEQLAKTDELLTALYAHRARCETPPYGIGIAGGLCAGNLRRFVEPFARRFPGLSIDAEGKLRSEQPEDKLLSGLVRAYVVEAQRVFREAYAEQ